jgi:hypothetical protein
LCSAAQTTKSSIPASQGLDKGAAFGTGGKTDTNPKGRIRFFGISGRQNPC